MKGVLEKDSKTTSSTTHVQISSLDTSHCCLKSHLDFQSIVQQSCLDMCSEERKNHGAA